MDKETKEFLTEQGIDVTSQKAVLDSTKSKVQEINKHQFEYEKEIQDLISH